MSADLPLSFEALDRALQLLGSLTGAAEAHGNLCGLGCLLGPEGKTAWFKELVADLRCADSDRALSLARLAAGTYGALEEGDMSFSPLLPSDERPLTIRADSLAEWCRGFMHGLESANGQAGAFSQDAVGASVAQEIVHDFSEIARLAVTAGDAGAEGEAAYAELVEYVRVSVQLMFEEMKATRNAAPGSALH